MHVRKLTALVIMIAASAGTSVARADTLHVAPHGDDKEGSGSKGQPYGTIQYAIDQARPGDTVFISGGVYRESIRMPRDGEPDARITIAGDPDGDVVLDGSAQITGWQRCDEDEPGLTVGGVRHPQATRIYKTRVDAKLLGNPATSSNMFEGERLCRVARWPDQQRGEGLDTGLLAPVPEDAFGQRDRLADPIHLDPDNEAGHWSAFTEGLSAKQLDAYWRGATITFWMRRHGNYTQAKQVTGYEPNTLLIESDLRRDLVEGDRYAISGHPHALSAAGEFYVGRDEDEQGRTLLYYWPEDPATVEESVCIRQRGDGIYAVHKDYITVRGLTVRLFRGRGIYFRHVAGSDGTNVATHVLDCDVRDVGNRGIWLQSSPGGRVEDCTVWRAGDRGIFITGSEDVTIARCTIGDTSSTCMSFYGVRRGKMIDNRIFGAVGVHSNGSSCYLGCRDILLARNIYYNGANATFQNIENFTLFANVWDGLGNRGNVVATWPNSRNSDLETHGHMLYLNNTIIRASRNIAVLFRFDDVHVHNNLIGGTASWSSINQRSHNGWVGRYGLQRPNKGWELGESSWQIPQETPGDASAKDLARIFRHVDARTPEKLDYRLAGDPESNPAIYAGMDVQQLLEDKGVKEAFPEVDFTVDLNGKPWAERPSMGAREYQP